MAKDGEVMESVLLNWKGESFSSLFMRQSNRHENAKTHVTSGNEPLKKINPSHYTHQLIIRC